MGKTVNRGILLVCVFLVSIIAKAAKNQNEKIAQGSGWSQTQT